MLMAQTEWTLDPFPSPTSDWVISLLHFAETLGEKCYALLEGNEIEHQRTYYGFGEGWIISPKTWYSSLPPDPLKHLRAFRQENCPPGKCESGIIGYLDYEWGLLWQKPKATTAKPSYFFRLCPINVILLPGSKKVVLEVFSKEEAELRKTFSHWSRNLEAWIHSYHPQSNPKDTNTTKSTHTTENIDTTESIDTAENINLSFEYRAETINPIETKPNPSIQITHTNPAKNTSAKPFSWQSNLKSSEFMSQVEKIKEYIRAGDIFQAVLSQRFTLYRSIDPWVTYQRLRVANPSPWLFCLMSEKETLVGSSPELLLSSVGSQLCTRPIAGTRPRGKSPLEDQQLEKELLQDEKERAEHAMLVDLGRNDLGRVANYGSVKVSEYCHIQRFSQVMHIVSTVEGQLDPAYDSLDALQAVLPAGTLSGAPKVRAMEILQELEPQRRGPYGGALGIYRWNGDLDFCITIRTLVIKDEEVSVQCGAGIVHDSIPEREYEETLHKARALFKVVE